MKTVAIVGSHEETRENAPWDDPDIDIWVFNEAFSQHVSRKGEPYKWCKRADAVFQMHVPAIYRNPYNRSDKGHWIWLQQEHGDLDIWMMEIDADVPNSRKYPLTELVGELLPGWDYPLLTSTPALAIALAVYLGYERIQYYGIEMKSDTEYRYQREGVQAWTFYALGRGVKVELYSAHEAFDQPLYGYEGRIDMDPQQFEKRVEELEAERKAAIVKIRQCEDILADTWNNPKILGPKMTDLATAHDELGYIDGLLHESRRYAFKAHDMVADGGEFFIDRNELESTAAQARKDITRFQEEVHRTAGTIGYLWATWDQVRNPTALNQLQQFLESHCAANYNNGKAKGIVDMNWEIANEVDKRIRAMGGSKAFDMLMTANHAV